MRGHAVMTFAADDNLRGLQNRFGLRAERRVSVSADADDVEPCGHLASRAGSSGGRAAGGTPSDLRAERGRGRQLARFAVIVPSPRQQRRGVHRCARQRGAASTAAQGEEGNAARSGGQLGFALRRADEADRKGQDRRRLRRAIVEHFQQMKQSGGRVADRDDGAMQMRPPLLDPGGGAGGRQLRRQLRRLRGVEGDNY